MNAAIWQSPEIIRNWAAEAERQEPKRAAQRRLMALLLPFGPQEAFTFLDVGAGTGAASRAILAHHPGAVAVLADFSAEMMRAGERDMRPFAGRYRYVEFDMLAGEWPETIPAALDAVVTRQAQIIAYIDDYKMLMIATLVVMPLLIVFKRPSRSAPAPVIVHD